MSSANKTKCECGCYVTKSNMTMHKKTKKHEKLIKNKTNINLWDDEERPCVATPLEYFEVQDFIKDKILTPTQLNNECKKLIKYADTIHENKTSFVGNKLLYHFQMLNLMKCANKNISFYDLITDPNNKDKYDKHYQDTIKRKRTGTMTNRLYEAWRINKGSIVFFKASQAMYLYKKYNGKKVLDFTMGWGGRMLGAWALGLDYVGIDTNINMKPAYDNMIKLLTNYDISIGRTSPKITIIWSSCLDVDYSKLDYDCVLTSPPYVNLEQYECMELWKNKDDFYSNFMLPVFNKVYDNLKIGHVCLNISPAMYNDFNNYITIQPNEEIDLKQQLGKAVKKAKDMIYIYKK